MTITSYSGISQVPYNLEFQSGISLITLSKSGAKVVQKLGFCFSPQSHMVTGTNNRSYGPTKGPYRVLRLYYPLHTFQEDSRKGDHRGHMLGKEGKQRHHHLDLPLARLLI